jgi:hypothetical protein
MKYLRYHACNLCELDLAIDSRAGLSKVNDSRIRLEEYPARERFY